MLSSAEFSTEQLALIELVNWSSAILSIVGELFMMYSYYRLPNIRTFPMKMVISLVASDFILSMSNVFNSFSERGCSFIGYMSTLGTISSGIWAVMILWVLHRQLVQYDPYLPKLYPRLLVINAVLSMIPLLVVMISQITGGEITYINSYRFCGIYPDKYLFILTGIPLIIIAILLFILAWKIMLAMNAALEEGIRVDSKKLLRYPFTLLALLTPAALDRLFILIYGYPNFWLVLLHVGTESLGGFINALIYGGGKLGKIKEELTAGHSNNNNSKQALSSTGPNEISLELRKATMLGNQYQNETSNRSQSIEENSRKKNGNEIQNKSADTAEIDLGTYIDGYESYIDMAGSYGRARTETYAELTKSLQI